MSYIETVDARGLSCPQPVMLARQALKNIARGKIEVLVDSRTALENVSRLAGHENWEVVVEALSGGNFRIILKK